MQVRNENLAMTSPVASTEDIAVSDSSNHGNGVDSRLATGASRSNANNSHSNGGELGDAMNAASNDFPTPNSRRRNKQIAVQQINGKNNIKK